MCWASGPVVKVLDFKQLARQSCGFESRQGLWILSCEEAIQLAYGTSVVLLRCPNVPEVMHGGRGGLPPPVKLESCHITSTVLVRRKTNCNQKYECVIQIQ